MGLITRLLTSVTGFSSACAQISIGEYPTLTWACLVLVTLPLAHGFNLPVFQMTESKKPVTSVTGFSSAFAQIRSLAMSYSHMGTPTLPSAQLRFTSEFGMGSGGATALLSLNKKGTILESFAH